MSSWSRARYVGEGQWPLRSRADPSGLPSLSAADSDRVLCANQVLEIASWVCYVTLRSKQFTYLLLMMPEDFGSSRVFPSILKDFLFGLARTSSFRRPCCLFRTPSSGLPMFSASYAHAWACWRYVPFCFRAHFSVGFWARIFSAIEEVSNPLSLTDGGHSQPSGSSSSAGVFEFFSVVFRGGFASSAFLGLVFARRVAVLAQGLCLR